MIAGFLPKGWYIGDTIMNYTLVVAVAILCGCLYIIRKRRMCRNDLDIEIPVFLRSEARSDSGVVSKSDSIPNVCRPTCRVSKENSTSTLLEKNYTLPAVCNSFQSVV